MNDGGCGECEDLGVICHRTSWLHEPGWYSCPSCGDGAYLLPEYRALTEAQIENVKPVRSGYWMGPNISGGSL